MEKSLNLDGFYEWIFTLFTKKTQDYINETSVPSPYFKPEFEKEPSKQEVWDACMEFNQDKIDSIMRDMSWLVYNTDFSGDPEMIKKIKNKYFNLNKKG